MALRCRDPGDVDGVVDRPGLKLGLAGWLTGATVVSGEPLMDLQPSSRQRELIARARHLARERFAARADRHDRDAAFPFEDYADLRAEGFLGLCVPERYGGLGADYETYCLVSDQLAQGNASTALTFNMHCLTMLMMGPIADNMAMPPGQRERHEAFRAAKYREVVEDAPFTDSRTASRWSRARPTRRSPSAAGASAPRRERSMAATSSTGGSSSSLSGVPPRIMPRPLFGSATSPGSSARSICRYPRTRRACPFPAIGTRWGCAPQSSATWCWTTCSSPTTRMCCRPACSGRCTMPFPISS